MQTFETFKPIENYQINDLIQKEPSCFNRMVRVVKYKITIEEIPEPLEVIQARIQKLWDENTNHHYYQDLISIGKKYDMLLE